MARIVFRQLFEMESCTYTYLIGCTKTRRALLIDPVRETVERDAKLIRELDLDLVYGLNTHMHADHITGTGQLKDASRFPNMKSVLSKHSGGRADVLIDHGDSIKLGNLELEVRGTPGHTDGCVSYISHDLKAVFTGDSLFIRGCGRTDFQKGSAKKLYESIHEQIYTLPDDYIVYPGHDYKGMLLSTIAEEKKWNPRLSLPEDKFRQFMRDLRLEHPKQIKEAIPWNARDGLPE